MPLSSTLPSNLYPNWYSYSIKLQFREESCWVPQHCQEHIPSTLQVQIYCFNWFPKMLSPYSSVNTSDKHTALKYTITTALKFKLFYKFLEWLNTVEIRFPHLYSNLLHCRNQTSVKWRKLLSASTLSRAHSFHSTGANLLFQLLRVQIYCCRNHDMICNAMMLKENCWVPQHWVPFPKMLSPYSSVNTSDKHTALKYTITTALKFKLFYKFLEWLNTVVLIDIHIYPNWIKLQLSEENCWVPQHCQEHIPSTLQVQIYCFNWFPKMLSPYSSVNTSDKHTALKYTITTALKFKLFYKFLEWLNTVEIRFPHLY